MSLTKAQIVENIQDQTGLTKIKATETVETLLEDHQSIPFFRRKRSGQWLRKILRKGKKAAQGQKPGYG